MNAASILVVDDEPQIRRVMRTTLSTHGYVIREATTGEEAVEAVRKERPDLILLDVNMPGIGGIEIPSTKGKKSETYVTVTGSESLAGLAQMNVLEIHPWGSTNDDLEHPDRIVFDLDPDEAVAWPTLRAAAVEVKERLAKMEPELAHLQEAHVASADRAIATQSAITAALNAAAERIEGITRRLNQSVPAADATVCTMLFSRIDEPRNADSTAMEITAAGIDDANVSPTFSPR